jgi:DNA (cytosine-5)-methyltransferase 1
MATSIEICAGAGGQALGLEMAGFKHSCLVEIEQVACETLRLNRPEWDVKCCDVREFSATRFRNVDLFAGGVPCPPFSRAGKQLGKNDERDLFPEAIRIVDECRPKAVMLENVRGLLDSMFADYRTGIVRDLEKMGYTAAWRLVNARDFGVSQLRPRAILVALQHAYADEFAWPEQQPISPLSVGHLLHDLMASRGWKGADAWRARACEIAPTIVGGSKKHGGPDLGPTRAKLAWKQLGVDGKTLANMPPDIDFDGDPRLTVRMAARIQGFPDSWEFSGKKTAAYRQVGNAFPPPVASAIGFQIKQALSETAKRHLKRA